MKKLSTGEASHIADEVPDAINKKEGQDSAYAPIDEQSNNDRLGQDAGEP